MRHFIFFIAFILGCSLISSAQNTLLVYTKWPSKLNFIDAFNKVIPFHSVWNEEEGGFEISYDELENTYVTTSDFASFKLSDQIKLTKLIAMSKDSKISLHQCFTNEKYCCEKLTDKQKKGTEKLYAVALMKKGHKLNKPIYFTESSTQSVSKIEDLKLEWESKLVVKSISILDVNNLETIYELDAPAISSLGYEQLKEVKDKFDNGGQYQLSAVLEQANRSTVKHHFNFSLQDLSFNSSEYHIPSKEVLNLGWTSDKTVKNVQIIDSASNKTIWTDDKFSGSSVVLKNLGKSSDLLNAGTEYTLEVELDNGKKFQHKFMILLDDSELAALKDIVE